MKYGKALLSSVLLLALTVPAVSAAGESVVFQLENTTVAVGATQLELDLTAQASDGVNGYRLTLDYSQLADNLDFTQATAAQGELMVTESEGLITLSGASGATNYGDVLATLTFQVEGTLEEDGVIFIILDENEENYTYYSGGSVAFDMALVSAEDATITQEIDKLALYDFNGDGVINYGDITAISPYYGHDVTDELSKYDVTGNGAIDSGDYLQVYENITK